MTPALRFGKLAHDYDGARQKLLGLHDNAEPATSLLVPPTFRKSQLIDVTSQHEDSP